MSRAVLVAALTAALTASAAQELTLEQAMDEAQRQSLDLVVVKARAKQAEQLSARAWAGYLPSISIGGTYTRNSVESEISLPTSYAIRQVAPAAPPEDPNPGLPGAPTNLALVPAQITTVVIQPANAFAAVGQLNQAVIAPALWPAIRAASYARDAALSGAEATRREVLFAVAQAFYGMATLQETHKVTERLAEVARAHEKDARVKEQAGAVARLTRLRAELDRSRAEQDVLRAKNALAAARLALAALLNRPADFDVAQPAEPKLPDDLLSPSPQTIPDGAAARPDVAAARAEPPGGEQPHVQMAYPPRWASRRYQLSNAAGFSGRAPSGRDPRREVDPPGRRPAGGQRA